MLDIESYIKSRIDNIYNDHSKLTQKIDSENDSLLRFLLDIPSIANLIHELSLDKTYKLKIPDKLVNAFKRGEAKLMQSKDGERVFADIVDQKNKVIGKADLSEIDFDKFEKLSEFAANQKIDAIIQRLEEVSVKTNQILLGQRNDRIGFVHASFSILLQAHKCQNVETRSHLLASAIVNAEIGRSQLILNSFEYRNISTGLASNQIGMFFEEFSANKKLKDITEGYFKVLNDFSKITDASILILLSHAINKDYESAKASLYSFQQTVNLLSPIASELSKKIQGNKKDTPDELAWYSDSQKLLENIEEFVTELKAPAQMLEFKIEG